MERNYVTVTQCIVTATVKLFCSISYETIPPVRLESSGGVLSTVDMVVQRRDGPRRLRDHDDDDDDDVLLSSLAVLLATPRTYFLHLSLSSVILTDASTGSPVHVLIFAKRAFRCSAPAV